MGEIGRLFFAELAPRYVGRSPLLKLVDLVSEEPQDHEEEIAQYLQSSPGYSAVGKAVGDVLDAQKSVALFPGLRTDGVYIWPAELSYYVRTYHVRIPSAFVQRMASLDWCPPQRSEIDMDRVAAEMRL